MHLVLHGSQHNPPLIFLGLLFVLLLVTVHMCLLVLFLFVVFQNPDFSEHSNHLLLLWLSSLEQQPADLLRSSSRTHHVAFHVAFLLCILHHLLLLRRQAPILEISAAEEFAQPPRVTRCLMYVLLAE